MYGVFMASQKLKHYFQGHPIIVVSSAPLGDIIQNREATGRIAKWAIELERRLNEKTLQDIQQWTKSTPVKPLAKKALSLAS